MTDKVIFMSEFDTVSCPDTMRTVLGSCIGIVLIDKKIKKYGMAHIMLPTAPKNSEKIIIGKYADTAIPELFKAMQSPTKNLVAVIAGGANMFKSTIKNTNTIGAQNIKAVETCLANLSIPIIKKDTGGNKGRQLNIITKENKVVVNAIGADLKTLFEF